MLGNINPTRTRSYVPMNRNDPYGRRAKQATSASVPMPKVPHPALRPSRPRPPQWLLDVWQIKI